MTLFELYQKKAELEGIRNNAWQNGLKDDKDYLYHLDQEIFRIQAEIEYEEYCDNIGSDY